MHDKSRIETFGRHSLDRYTRSYLRWREYSVAADQRPSLSPKPAASEFVASRSRACVDEANLSESMKWFVRESIPTAAILLPIAFFLSVLKPDATKPNRLIYLAYVGAVILTAGLLVLGIGLLR